MPKINLNSDLTIKFWIKLVIKVYANGWNFGYRVEINFRATLTIIKLGFILILAHFPATWELKIWKFSNFGQNHFSDFESPFLACLAYPQNYKLPKMLKNQNLFVFNLYAVPLPGYSIPKKTWNIIKYIVTSQNYCTFFRFFRLHSGQWGWTTDEAMTASFLKFFFRLSLAAVHFNLNKILSSKRLKSLKDRTLR